MKAAWKIIVFIMRFLGVLKLRLLYHLWQKQAENRRMADTNANILIIEDRVEIASVIETTRFRGWVIMSIEFVSRERDYFMLSDTEFAR